jgi:hypothetical protein
MARLPQPGKDAGTWGTILNEFMGVSHTATGTLKPGIVKDENISEVSQSKITGLLESLGLKADDSTVLHNTSDEMVSGTKIFTTAPLLPTPVSDGSAANKSYVDSLPGHRALRITADVSVPSMRDSFYSVDASGGSVTVQLPAADGVMPGRQYQVKKVDASANTVIISGVSIDGATTAVITTRYEVVTVISDGTEWLII